MTKLDWITNIENAATKVEKKSGRSTVEFVLQKFGASSIEDLSESRYSEVWDELDFVANDN